MIRTLCLDILRRESSQIYYLAAPGMTADGWSFTNIAKSARTNTSNKAPFSYPRLSRKFYHSGHGKTGLCEGVHAAGGDSQIDETCHCGADCGCPHLAVWPLLNITRAGKEIFHDKFT
jgi:hypothetical protein